jgi:hypothetical protein
VQETTTNQGGAKVDKQTETELRHKHGDIAIAKVAGKEFAFRTPTDTDYEEFQQGLIKVGNDKAKAGPTFREFCLKCLVYPEVSGKPDLDSLEASFRAQPATPLKIGDKLSELAGADVEITVKKG